jgi:hypothetical protein
VEDGLALKRHNVVIRAAWHFAIEFFA